MKTTSMFWVITTSLMLLGLFASVRPVVAASGTPAPVISICGVIPRDAGTPFPGNGDSMSTHDRTVQPIEFDLLFIDMMIPHHESAVVMAQIALERADHPEIQELARNIIASQTAEIAQLQAWRDAWFPAAVELTMPEMTVMMKGYISGMMDMGDSPMGEMAGMDLDSALLSMCNAQEPFDLAFLTEMIPHHQSAIEMANAGLENSTHQELKDLQLQIIEAQQGEIDLMQALRIDWYGESTPVA